MMTDVCIFGAGPAAVATAIRLADRGLAVTILERPLRAPAWVGETFAGGIRAPLETLGLWDEFCAARHVPSYEIRSAWGTPERLASSTLVTPYGHAWHVDRERFNRDLVRAATARGCALRTYRSLARVARCAGGWDVHIDGDVLLHARFLVDATGRCRALGRRLGARRRHFDTLVAVVRRVPRHPDPAYGHAIVVETCSAGWWYAAPTPNGHVLAFLTDHDLLDAGQPRGDAHVVAADSAVFDGDAPAGWLAVGDAFASHDPLFGTGVIHALGDGIRAADAIAAHAATGDRGPLDALHDTRLTEFERYLEGLRHWYTRERAWPASRFWSRRMAPPGLS